MKRVSDIYKKIFVVGFVLAGVCLMVAGVIGLHNASTFSPTTATVRSVERVEAIDEDDTDVYAFTVDYTVDGKSYSAVIEKNSNDHAVGGQMDILYDPANPDVITLPGATASIVILVVGAAAVVGTVLYFVFKRKKKEKAGELFTENNYAASVQGADRELYFLTDTGTAKVGHRIEDKDRKVLYEAKVTKFTLAAPTRMDFIDHVHGTTTPHKVGHTATSSFNSILADIHSTFTYDGEDIWDHLHRCGVTVDSGFAQGKILRPQYRIFRDGQQIALVETSSGNVHEEDGEKKKLGNLLIARGFYRIQTREENLDLLFVAIMAFARTEASDDTGGNFGMLFSKK